MSSSLVELVVVVVFTLSFFSFLPDGKDEVDNDDDANYDYGIGGAGTRRGGDVEHIGLGIVQWF